MVAAASASVGQFGAMVIYSYPADEGKVAGLGGIAVAESSPPVNASQLGVMVVVRGRIEDPSVLVWTFPLDDHEFYIIRLGDSETLAFDKYSGQWANWGSGDLGRWRAKTGCMWQGAGGLAAAYGSNIVVGDEVYGTIYFLDPNYPYDDDPVTGAEDISTFHRVAEGQIPHRGRDPISCYSVQLTGSFGDVYDASLTEVTLSYSDDAGRTFVDAGTLDITVADYAARAEWRSMGLIRSPGRMFKIEDDGALARIDSLDIADG